MNRFGNPNLRRLMLQCYQQLKCGESLTVNQYLALQDAGVDIRLLAYWEWLACGESIH